MREPEAYRGREQTYLKHYFLERYLERVAFNIGWYDNFVYVDGFSGPWRCNDDALEDTSFMIAINKLRSVRDALASRGKTPTIRCMFVEENTQRFSELKAATERIPDLDILPIHSTFEGALPAAQKYIGSSFVLTFIDPTGWKGFALKKLAPLLRKRGEVLINFMFEHINRFLTDKREEIIATFEELFGGQGWENCVGKGEGAILDFYQQRLRSYGQFKFVTRTRVLMPLRDRTYFHLVYGTRHPKGLEEFRRVEKQFLFEQEGIRADARQAMRVEQTGQAELFRDADTATGPLSMSDEALRNKTKARSLVLALLSKEAPLRFGHVIPSLLEIPTIDKPTAKKIVRELHDERLVQIQGLGQRKRLPDDDCLLMIPSEHQ